MGMQIAYFTSIFQYGTTVIPITTSGTTLINEDLSLPINRDTDVFAKVGGGMGMRDFGSWQCDFSITTRADYGTPQEAQVALFNALSLVSSATKGIFSIQGEFSDKEFNAVLTHAEPRIERFTRLFVSYNFTLHQ